VEGLGSSAVQIPHDLRETYAKNRRNFGMGFLPLRNKSSDHATPAKLRCKRHSPKSHFVKQNGAPRIVCGTPFFTPK